MYKKVLMGLCAFVISSILYAENAKNDVIYTRDNKKIEAIIKEMSKDVIKYIEADNVDGPLYILSTDEIYLIELRNGKIQTFNPNVNQPVVENQQASTPTNQQTNTPTKQQTNTPASNTLVQKDFTIKKKTRFQSNIDLGGVITEESGIVAGGVLFDVGAGARITDYFYIGATLGLHSEWAEIGYAKSSALVLPIYADLRGYIPNKSNVLPFFNLGIGGFCGLSGKVNFSGTGYYNGQYSSIPEGGFFLQFGAGVDIKRFTIDLGYRLLKNSAAANYFFFKIGVRLGKN